MFTLLLLLVAVVAASEIPDDLQSYIMCRTLHRNALLDCFITLVDTNHNGSIDDAEISTFVKSSTPLLSICDTNHDGILDMVDWNAETGCAYSQPIITRACNMCVRAGWSPLNKKK